MTITFSYFDYNYFFVIITVLWIIQSGSLVAGSHFLKGEEDAPRFLNSLFIAGIISILWYITRFFIPTGISITSESDKLTFFSIVLILYIILPNSIFIIVGVAFLIFFYKNIDFYKKMLIYTPILIIVGGVLRLTVHSLMQYFIYQNDIEALFDFNDYALALEILSLCLQLAAIIIIFLYAIYLNNRFFLTFSCLFFVQILYILIPIQPYV
ncbi:MAG: hypothetical protein ACFE94_02585 [Candidatus Hodarchaeota archaeon]